MKLFRFLFLFSATAWAQLPDAPSQAYWPTVAVLGGSIVTDAESTHNFIERGCHEVWNVALYGRTPSRLRFYGVSGAIFGVSVLASYQMRKSRYKALHWLALGLLAYQAQDRIHGTINNYHLMCP